MADDRYNLRKSAKVARLFSTYDSQGREAFLREVEVALNTPTDLTFAEVNFLQFIKQKWSHSLDSPIKLPLGVRHEDVSFVLPHWSEAFKSGNYRRSLELAWMYLQHNTVADQWFRTGLSMLADSAAAVDDIPLSKCAIDMYLSHLQLLSLRTVMSLNQSDKKASTEVNLTGEQALIGIPIRAAIIGYSQLKNDCWIRIMNLYLEQYSTNRNSGQFLREVKSTLMRYYQESGDSKNIKRIAEY